MTTTHPKASDDSVTRTALWALVAVSGVANLVTSVAQAPLVVNLVTGLVTLAALTALGVRHLRARRAGA
ncbi:hypothetical protein QWL27_08085 [Streptomyces thermocarboxydus]|uniref:hypothetical protein n=1 Tax=Streptomyces TaxID=1883 RepID=UPI0020C71448|nr:hypothetical protein [Streptomyces sp. AC04842]MDN3285720.1 hypothetical protein [Streptomyces thermocarboxydus]